MKTDTEITAAPNSTSSRGKQAHLLQAGITIAVLAPDVVEHFPDSESANNALRAFLAFGKQFVSRCRLHAVLSAECCLAAGFRSANGHREKQGSGSEIVREITESLHHGSSR